MKLPELSADASPEFTDAATCKEWLEHVPLANVATAQANLLEQLQEFNRFPTAAAPRLAVLEGLREAVHFVQIEQAKRFANRALPMSEQEKTAFDTTIALWDQMCAGYQRCLDGAINRDSGMRAQAALVCQRLLSYIGLRMFHHYRAYREVPAEDWRSVHETFAAAEELDVAEDAVKDFLNRDIQDTSPRIAYARAMLMGLCNPNELAQRQLTFVAYLLERWGDKLEVESKPVDEGEGVPPLVADLKSDSCPERGESKARDPRYLDTRKLAKSLRNRVALLRKGESPAKLALGEDCVQPSCEQTLVFLFRQWCQARSERPLAARAATLTAQVTNDMEAIHHYMSAGSQRRQVEARELTPQQRQELETLGHIRSVHNEQYTSERGYALEDWRILDDSATELQIVRATGGGAKRYAHGQLVAVRPPDASGFILGQVRWLIGAVNGDLRAGVKL